MRNGVKIWKHCLYYNRFVRGITRVSNAELRCFLACYREQAWTNNRVPGDFRCHNAHERSLYGIIWNHVSVCAIWHTHTDILCIHSSKDLGSLCQAWYENINTQHIHIYVGQCIMEIPISLIAMIVKSVQRILFQEICIAEIEFYLAIDEKEHEYSWVEWWNHLLCLLWLHLW